jgi:hypothetical protein
LDNIKTAGVARIIVEMMNVAMEIIESDNSVEERAQEKYSVRA